MAKIVPLKRLILISLVVLCGCLAVWRELGPYYLPALGEFLYIPFILLIGLTTVASFIDKNHQTQNKLYQYTTTIAGLVFCSVVIFRISYRTIINNKENQLVVSNLSGAKNVMAFEFKEDGDFKLTERDLLSSTAYYGKYKKISDTLLILKSNYINGCYAKELPIKGIIQGNKVFWEKFDTMVIDTRKH